MWIQIRSRIHNTETNKKLDCGAQMGRGGKVGSRRGRSEGADLEGENERGAGVEGFKPKCEDDGGVPWQCGKKIYWAEKFSYRTANAPPHHPHT